jgi:hypothetical protein
MLVHRTNRREFIAALGSPAGSCTCSANDAGDDISFLYECYRWKR